jgi:hypothetical protein
MEHAGMPRAAKKAMASAGNFSRREFAAMALGAMALRAATGEPGGRVDVQSVSQRMVAQDKWRTETLHSYSVDRCYRLTLGNSNKCAEMRVKVEYVYPGRKTFEVISKTNSGYLEDRIFHQALNAELQADNRDGVRVLPCNYDFQVLGTEELSGRAVYVIRVKPKWKKRPLVDGQVWVDMEDAAVTRIDGEVASTSFWVRSFHMVQSYERVGRYWLVNSIRNDASVRFLGQARLDIEYTDYRLRTV